MKRHNSERTRLAARRRNAKPKLVLGYDPGTPGGDCEARVYARREGDRLIVDRIVHTPAKRHQNT